MSPEQIREGFEATYLKYLMKIYRTTDLNEEVLRPIYFARSVYNNEQYSMLMVQEAWLIFELAVEWSNEASSQTSTK